MTAPDTIDDFFEPLAEEPRRPVLPRSLIVLGVFAGGLLIAGGAATLVMTGLPDAPEAGNAPAQAARERPSHPTTAAGCEALGRRLEEAAAGGDAKAVGALFDWPMMVRRAARGLEVGTKDLGQFLEGVRQGAERGPIRRLADAAGQGGRFDFLKVVERNGERRALCRLVTPEGGVDFFELLPIGTGAETRVGDAYVYSTGEDMSAMMRRSLLAIAAHQNRSLLDRLSGTEVALVKHGEALEQLAEAHSRGDWPATLTRYDALPEEVRREKHVLLIALFAAAISDEERYVTLVEKFRTAHAGDPALELLLVDYHYLRGERRAAADALRRLDERVGGDAFVKTLIAGILLEEERRQDAESLLEEAVAAEPDLVHAHVGLVGSAVVAEDAALGVRRLREMQRDLKVDPAGLREALAAYPHAGEFFASKAYREWEAGR